MLGNLWKSTQTLLKLDKESLNNFPADWILFESLEWQNFERDIETQNLKSHQSKFKCHKIYKMVSRVQLISECWRFLYKIIDWFSIYWARKLFCVGGNNFYYYRRPFLLTHIKKISNDFPISIISIPNIWRPSDHLSKNVLFMARYWNGKKIDPFHPARHSKWN